jgi:3-hydroxybutyryl-CoA dehydrogenase
MSAKTDHLEQTAVLGAGTMGHGIAQLLALAGHQVCLYDPDPIGLAAAPGQVQASLESFISAGLVTPEQAEDCLERIELAGELEPACQGADLVIEAAPEKIELKLELLARVEELAGPKAIICTNTSAISITELAQGLKDSTRFLGTHFWNPAQVIPCVELVPGPDTDPKHLDRVVQIMREAGKEPVRLNRDIPGFLGNRLQHALQREAMSLVDKGVASPEEVDRVVRYGFGLRLALMGPMERADLGGLDTTLAVQTYLVPKLEDSLEPSPKLKSLVEEGHVGAKAGKGFFDWPKEKLQKRAAQRDRLLLELLRLVREPE